MGPVEAELKKKKRNQKKGMVIPLGDGRGRWGGKEAGREVGKVRRGKGIEKVRRKEDGSLVDTHQRFIHGPVESCHRVCPNVRATRPANLTQPALAAEPAPGRRNMLEVVMKMRTVVVVVRLSEITCSVQEVFLDAALARERASPAHGQGAALGRPFAVDAAAAVPVPGAGRHGGLVFAPTVQAAVRALGVLSGVPGSIVGREAAPPLEPGPDVGVGAGVVRQPFGLPGFVLPRLGFGASLLLLLGHLGDAVEALRGAQRALADHLPLQVPVTTIPSVQQVLPSVISLRLCRRAQGLFFFFRCTTPDPMRHPNVPLRFLNARSGILFSRRL